MSDNLPATVDLQVIPPESKPKRRGRKPKAQFDDNTRALVHDMALWGVPVKAMCQHVRDPNTGEALSQRQLSDAFEKEIAQGTADGDATLARNLWLQANGRPAEYGERDGKVVKLRDELRPQPGPAIFLSKVRLGYRETAVVEHRNFNLNVFHEMKGQFAKMNQGDLVEFGQRWKAKGQPKEKVRQAVSTPSGGDGDVS